MFISLTLSSFFSIMQQGRAREAAEEGNRGSIVPRRGGLTRRMIDSLPLKHYDIAETAGSVDSSNNSSLEESECCPICLVRKNSFYIIVVTYRCSFYLIFFCSQNMNKAARLEACHAAMIFAVRA